MIQVTYIIYLIVSIIIIIYVGEACVVNGKVYILNYFPDKKQFAFALNNALRIAYYCLNIGLSVWSLHSINPIYSYQAMIVEIATRLSFIVLLISGLHFFNLITIYFIHKHFKNNLL